MHKGPLSALILVFTLPVIAHAQWQLNGTPVSTATGSQRLASAAPDGTGGAIIAWQDDRTGGVNDIYVQRVDGLGIAKWTAGGLPLCTATASQSDPVICSDGAGGAIVAWNDFRNSATSDIYAQRINAAGVAQWLPANGVAVSTATNLQSVYGIVPDCCHGAYIVWEDARNSTQTLTLDIYAQHLSDQGVPQATANGVAVCTAPSNQSEPIITADGAGSAIVAWNDQRDGTNDIYAQRVMSNGFMQWTAGGVGICVHTQNQFPTSIAADGAGGAVIAWRDHRNLESGGIDVFAQRVDEFGTVLWTTNGVAVCTRTGNQSTPVVACDSAGNAIIAWEDLTLGDIYAQLLSPAGALMWAANGASVCMAAFAQNTARIVPDGAGGAVIAWNDFRTNGASDLYAQRVDATGSAQWTSNGVALSTAANTQGMGAIVSDGSGGAVVAWNDDRNGNPDVYALRLASSGSTPTAVRTTPVLSEAALSPNFPAPFSGSTSMYLSLRHDADVHAEVFDVTGRSVRAIQIGLRPAGTTQLAFDGRDDRGAPLPSGVYFFRVHAGIETVTRKIVIAR
jgi:hypothetical protein